MNLEMKYVNYVLMEVCMFRSMRRKKQQVSVVECEKILKEEKRAAFSVIGENGYPYTIPVNFYFNKDKNCIYIHGAKSGHKIDAIQQSDKVCFTVWNQGYKTQGNWEWNATSVVVFGKAELIELDDFGKSMLRKIAEKYYPTKEEAEEEMKLPPIHVVQMIEIQIEHMTGKLVNER